MAGWVKSVEIIQIEITDGNTAATDVALTKSQDNAKCIPILTHEHSGSDIVERSEVMPAMVASGNKVGLSRIGTGGLVKATIMVLEVNFALEEVDFTHTGGSETTKDITLSTSVTVADAFVYGGSKNSDTSDDYDNRFVQIRLSSDGTKVETQRNGSGGTVTGKAWVCECPANEFDVQHILFDISSADGLSDTATIPTAVTLARTFLLCSNRTNRAFDDGDDAIARCEPTSTTELTGTRGGAGSSVFISAQVIQMTTGTGVDVQRGNWSTWPWADETRTREINAPTDSAFRILIHSNPGQADMCSTGASSGVQNEKWARLFFVDSDTLQGNRCADQTAGNGGDLEGFWQVIEFEEVSGGGATLSGAIGTATATGLNGTITPGPVTASGSIASATATGLVGSLAAANTLAGAIATATATGLVGSIIAANILTGALATATATGLDGSIAPGPVTAAGEIGIATAIGLDGTITNLPPPQTLAGVIATATATGLDGSIAPGPVTAAGAIGIATASGLDGSLAAANTLAGVIGIATAIGLDGTVTIGGDPQTLVGAIATATATGLIGSISPGPVTAQGVIATATATGLDGTVTNGGAPQTLVGAIATATATGLTGSIAPGPVTAQGAIATATATGLDGSIAPGPVTAAGSISIATAISLDGSIVPGPLTLAGSIGISTAIGLDGSLAPGPVTASGSIGISVAIGLDGSIAPGPVTAAGSISIATAIGLIGSLSNIIVGFDGVAFLTLRYRGAELELTVRQAEPVLKVRQADIDMELIL